MLGCSGRFWQDGFHDHAVRKYEDVVNLARFVVMNPIRGGLVKAIRDYSIWDAVFDLEDLLNNDEKQSPLAVRREARLLHR